MKLEELLSTTRPNAEKVVIFYTDGEMYPCLTCADELMEEARELREGQKCRILFGRGAVSGFRSNHD